MFPFPNPLTASARASGFVSTATTSVPGGGSAPVPISTLGATSGDILVYSAVSDSSFTLTTPGFSATSINFNSGGVTFWVGCKVITAGDISSPPSLSATVAAISVGFVLYRGAGAATLKGPGGQSAGSTTIATSFMPAANHMGAIFLLGGLSGPITGPGSVTLRLQTGQLSSFDQLTGYAGASTSFTDGVTAAKAIYPIELTG